MNHSNQQLKRFSAKPSVWLYRLLLALVGGLMTYVVSRQSYNFAHWVPHGALRRIGASYEHLLWFEQHADYFLHFFGALFLTVILAAAQLPILKQTPLRPILFTIFLCIAAEALQYVIGRGVESRDLLLGILGSFMAYLAIDKNKKNRSRRPIK